VVLMIFLSVTDAPPFGNDNLILCFNGVLFFTLSRKVYLLYEVNEFRRRLSFKWTHLLWLHLFQVTRGVEPPSTRERVTCFLGLVFLEGFFMFLFVGLVSFMLPTDSTPSELEPYP